MKRPLLWTFLLSTLLLLLMNQRMWGALWGIGTLVAIFPAGLSFFYKRSAQGWTRHQKRRMMAVWALVLLVFARGCLWERGYEKQRERLEEVVNKEQVLSGHGTIESISETQYNYVFRIKKCHFVSEKVSRTPARVVFYISKSRSGQDIHSIQYQRGDVISFSGVAQWFESPLNEGGYDETAYEKSNGVLCKFEDPSVSCIRKGNFWFQWTNQRIQAWGELFYKYMPQEDAGIGRALLCGEKDGLSKEDETLFYDVGVGHVLAISGLHLSVLGMGLYAFLEKMGMPLYGRNICSVGMVSAFCLWTGCGVSALRAVLMFVLLMGAEGCGRRYDYFSAVGFAGVVILFIRPYAVLSVAFRYSFLAIVGVGMTQRYLKRCYRRLHPLAEGLLISLGAWCFTLPITALNNYEVSWVGILLNLPVIPLMTPVLALFVLLGLWDMVPMIRNIEILPRMISFVLQGLLDVLRQLCTWGEKVPHATIITGEPSFWAVIFYLVLIAGLLGYSMKKRRVLAPLLMLVPILFMCNHSKEKEGALLVMLDVGQGDGIYLSDDKDHHFFIDGGSSSVSQVGEYRILPFLKSRGIRRIDGWFVSHCDTDHISGLLEVLEDGYTIERIYLYKNVVRDENLYELLEAADRAKTQICYLESGSGVATKELEWRCLNLEEPCDDKNESSMVLLATYKENNVRMLFAGDISITMEDKLVEIWNLEEISIWKATHHGSKYSNGENILQEMTPRISLLSYGKENRYGHPAKESYLRLQQYSGVIYETGGRGQIKIRLEDENN